MIPKELQDTLRKYSYSGDFTLDGLIRACGYGFDCLKQMPMPTDKTHTKYQMVWQAKVAGESQFAGSPEEAVAKAWLRAKREQTARKLVSEMEVRDAHASE